MDKVKKGMAIEGLVGVVMLVVVALAAMLFFKPLTSSAGNINNLVDGEVCGETGQTLPYYKRTINAFQEETDTTDFLVGWEKTKKAREDKIKPVCEEFRRCFEQDYKLYERKCNGCWSYKAFQEFIEKEEDDYLSLKQIMKGFGECFPEYDKEMKERYEQLIEDAINDKDYGAVIALYRLIKDEDPELYQKIGKGYFNWLERQFARILINGEFLDCNIELHPKCSEPNPSSSLNCDKCTLDSDSKKLRENIVEFLNLAFEEYDFVQKKEILPRKITIWEEPEDSPWKDYEDFDYIFENKFEDAKDWWYIFTIEFKKYIKEIDYVLVSLNFESDGNVYTVPLDISHKIDGNHWKYGKEFNEMTPEGNFESGYSVSLVDGITVRVVPYTLRNIDNSFTREQDEIVKNGGTVEHIGFTWNIIKKDSTKGINKDRLVGIATNMVDDVVIDDYNEYNGEFFSWTSTQKKELLDGKPVYEDDYVYDLKGEEGKEIRRIRIVGKYRYIYGYIPRTELAKILDVKGAKSGEFKVYPTIYAVSDGKVKYYWDEESFMGSDEIEVSIR